MQLVAYGAQDIYLTGNPQITFFKVVYRRHTNFAMESVDQTLNGGGGQGGKHTATISRNGDLVGRMYLEMTVAAATADVMNVGHNVIDNVEVQIGGQMIDKQFGHWMEVWTELTEPNSAGLVGDKATAGSGTRFQNLTGAGGCVAHTTQTCRVPLQFWFNRNPGLALPLIALQYHEVKVMITYAGSTSGLTPSNAELWADYIYLDTDERRRFAQVSHEYLIEQVQHTTGSSASIDLNFNHPVKELVWSSVTTAASGVREALSTGKAKLVLNGHDRFAERDREYFTQTQVWQHHTGTPVTAISGTTTGIGKAATTEVAVYSFALKPEEHQPSGTCNFSRIDNAQLKITGNSDDLNIYAVNYNVLRVMSGMGGLAYSN